LNIHTAYLNPTRRFLSEPGQQQTGAIAFHSSAWKPDDRVPPRFEPCYTFCARACGSERLLKRHGVDESGS
jgi:hypothetical protein